MNSALPGAGLERLVALIEGTLARDDRYKVELRKRLRDRDTGRLREHDVVLTWSDRHHLLVTALECRDRSRPVGVPDVEAFHTKCMRTGVDRCVIVSSRGFRQSARAKADQMGVGCMELTVAEQFDWCAMPGLLGRHKHVHHVEVRMWPCEPFEAARSCESDSLKLFAAPGVPFDAELVNANIDANIPWDNFTLDDEHFMRIELNSSEIFAEVGDGSYLPIRNVTLDVRFSIEEVMHPLLFRSYSDGNHTYAVATSSFEARGKTIRFALVRDAVDETHISATIEDN